MCGVCGIFNFDPAERVSPALLESMTAILYHRGPDDDGFFTQANIGLGHPLENVVPGARIAWARSRYITILTARGCCSLPESRPL